MRAAILYGPRDLRVEETASPLDSGDQVMLRVLANGICGSDLSVWRRGKPQPVILGHEIAAEVMTGPDAGRIAAVNQGNRCGICPHCEAGLDHFCTGAVGLGAVRFGGTFGGLGEFITAPAERVLIAPAGLDPAVVALSEPLGNAIRALAQPEVVDAESAVVIGCGPIGLALVAALRASGVANIIAIEGRPQRAAMAATLGADQVLAPVDDIRAVVAECVPVGADLVIEAAGKAETIDLAGELARPGGTVFLQGIPLEPYPLRLWTWTLKELTVRTSVGLSALQHQDALDMIATTSDTVPWVDLITRRVPLDDAPAAFEALDRGADEIKVVIEHGA